MTISFAPARSIPGTEGQDAEPPQIAASGGNVYLLWPEFPTPGSAEPDIFFTRSTNRGGAFAPRINLSNSAGVDSRDEDMTVSGRDVFVVWSEGGTDILFRRSTDAGGTLSSPRTLSTAAGAIRPQVEAHGDDVYAVWEATGPAGTTDVFLAHSHDRGRTFSAETNVSNTSGASESAQVTVSGDRVIVTWRDDTAAGMGYEVFVAQGK